MKKAEHKVMILCQQDEIKEHSLLCVNGSQGDHIHTYEEEKK